jgi:hypothetical protein
MALVAARADMREHQHDTEFSWHAFYNRSDIPGGKGRLRASPTVGNSIIGPVIECGQLLHVQSHKQVDGFLPVTLVEFDPDMGRPPCWVRAKHILWLKDEDTQWAVLDDDVWYGQSWTLDVSKLSIRVSEGGNLFSDLADFDTTVGESGDAFRSAGYTYVSLDVDYPWSSGESLGRRWHQQVCHAHHITLAYLPPMEEPDRRLLKWHLSEVLQTWGTLAPCERPYKIMKYRNFERKDLE